MKLKLIKKMGCILLIVSNIQWVIAEESNHPTSLDQYSLNVIQTKIRDIQWLASQAVIIAAVTQQNNSHLTIQEIHSRDKQWQASSSVDAFKLSMQQGECGLFLQSIVNNGKVFNEIIVTDNQGANVKAYPVTSDYWQGDEKKWIEPFQNNKIYIGEIEFDKSSQELSVQVSIPIKQDEEKIGVLVAGIKMSYIEYKMLKQYLNQQVD